MSFIEEPPIESRDVVFTGGGGLCFGSMYGDHIALNLAGGDTTINVWYNVVSAGIADGTLHNVTHDGNGKLTVANAGHYLVHWDVALQSDAANDEAEGGIEVSNSGTADPAGVGHFETKFAAEEEHMSGSAILDLAAGATLEVTIRSTIGATVITIDDVDLVCVQVGGT